MSDFSKDIDALIAGVSAPSKCSLGRLIEKIKDQHGNDVTDKLVALIQDRAYSSNQIISLLNKHGYKIGRDSVNKHRRMGKPDGCKCSA